MDTVSEEARSRIMSRIRCKDTGPEMVVRRSLHAAGLRYRLHAKGLPGRPDIVLAGHRLAVFVNGCFWHRCSICRPKEPESNMGYWGPKLRRNVERDAENVSLLMGMGWRVETIWECSLEDGVRRVLEICGKGGSRV